MRSGHSIRLVLPLGLLIAVAGFLWIRSDRDPGQAGKNLEFGGGEQDSPGEQRIADAVALPGAASVPPERRTERNGSSQTDSGLPASSGQGPRELQAYRLAVSRGVITLEGSTRITGDFRQRRGPPAWRPEMWCVRLLDAGLRVLSEETALAPDAPCFVLDADAPGTHGLQPSTAPVQLAGAGEEAMLQVRLPPDPGARWLRVYRIRGMEPVPWDAGPPGALLASIPLP